MITLRRKHTRINEYNEATSTVVEITDPALLQKKTAIEKQKLQLKTTYVNAVNRLDAQLIQLGKQQSQLNAKNNSQKSNTETNDNENKQNADVNEGKNHKHEILSSIIKKVNNDLDLSYSLSDDEIFRMARKLVDIINENKNTNNLVDIIRYELKKYCLNHNKISLSQSELNKFLNEFEKLAAASNYNVISNIFNNMENKIYFNDDTNVDELEAELLYLDIDVIDEDLNKNVLTVEFPKKYSKHELRELLSDFNIMKNNSHLVL